MFLDNFKWLCDFEGATYINPQVILSKKICNSWWHYVRITLRRKPQSWTNSSHLLHFECDGKKAETELFMSMYNVFFAPKVLFRMWKLSPFYKFENQQSTSNTEDSPTSSNSSTVYCLVVKYRLCKKQYYE